MSTYVDAMKDRIIKAEFDKMGWQLRAERAELILKDLIDEHWHNKGMPDQEYIALQTSGVGSIPQVWRDASDFLKEVDVQDWVDKVLGKG